MSFIGVSFGVIDNRLVCIATSERYSVCNIDGLTSKQAISFLWSIAYVRDKLRKTSEPQIPLVTFDCAVDVELVLRDLSNYKKDVLFGFTRKAENEIAAENNPLVDTQSDDYRGVAECYGYRLSQLPGKIFRIAPGPKMPKHSGLAFYDVSSYFACGDLPETVAKFLPKQAGADLTVEKNLLPLWRDGLAEKIIDKCEAEAVLIVNLAEKIKSTIEPLDLKPTQWYGPSAIAARCLHKWEARKQSKRLHVKNSASELLHAIDCAYFGGRVEQIRTGTVKDVRVFDLNSAYAYAVTLLSQFYTPLRFTRKYDPSQPFACWLVDYQLPEDVTIGPLPTRSPHGGISFRKRGRGYFWQPEVDYLRQRYPESFGIKWGYVGDYKPVKFAGDVHKMYDYRNELKESGDSGEAIVKLALSNLYGKFAQNTGQAHFQCRAWAGWITSLVRRLLLEAVTGLEDRVICFCQDAVHLHASEAAQVQIGSGLGEWKRSVYRQGLYVSPGIYDLTAESETENGKSARRGSNLQLDFQRIAQELSDRQASELSRSFFVGYQLARQAPVKYQASYLQDVSETLDLIPSRLRARNYLAEFDWLTENRDSTINSQFSGQLSSRYMPQPDQTHPAALRLRLKDRGWT